MYIKYVFYIKYMLFYGWYDVIGLDSVLIFINVGNIYKLFLFILLFFMY